MKKIFTLVAATLLTAAVFAADHKPSVTLTAPKNYEVVIDGKTYFIRNGVMDISSLRNGQHTIKVYEETRRFMSRNGKKLVSSTTFQTGRSDIAISVDFRGKISITEKKSGRDDWGKNGHDKDDRKPGHNGRF